LTFTKQKSQKIILAGGRNWQLIYTNSRQRAEIVESTIFALLITCVALIRGPYFKVFSFLVLKLKYSPNPGTQSKLKKLFKKP
jgi:hypothetical protein